MLFKKVKTFSREKLVDCLISIWEKKLATTEIQFNEMSKEIDSLELKRLKLFFEKQKIESILKGLKETRFLYYIRSGK